MSTGEKAGNAETETDSANHHLTATIAEFKNAHRTRNAPAVNLAKAKERKDKSDGQD